MQIPNKRFEDNGLLNILLSEIRSFRLDDIEELRDDSCYSSEEVRSRYPFELI